MFYSDVWVAPPMTGIDPTRCQRLHLQQRRASKRTSGRWATNGRCVMGWWDDGGHRQKVTRLVGDINVECRYWSPASDCAMMVSTWLNMFQHVSTHTVISTHNFDIFQPWEAGQCLVSHPWMKRNHFYQIFLGIWTTYGSTIGWTLSAMVHLLQGKLCGLGPWGCFFV